MSCKVKNCRYPHTHTTAGHKCGTCNKYGHGQIECGNKNLMDKLKIYHSDCLDNQYRCTLTSCKYKWSHSTCCHNCHKCGKNHESRNCIIQNLEYFQINYMQFFRELKNDFNFYTFLDNNSYTEFYVGMGCNIYIRKKNNIVEGIFMHSDSWGQYGPTTDDSIIYEKFIEGLTNKTSDFNDINNYNNIEYYECDKIIKCPLCRMENKTSDTFEIKGNKEKCSVCLDNNIELYFKNCMHACICKKCYIKL